MIEYIEISWCRGWPWTFVQEHWSLGSPPWPVCPDNTSKYHDQYQSESELESVRNSCNVFTFVCHFFTFFTCADLPNNVYHLLIFLYFFIFYILWITCADLPNLLAKERRGEKWPRSWGRQPRLLEMPKCWMIILIIVDYCWLYAIDNPQCLRCLDIRRYVGIDYWF